MPAGEQAHGAGGHPGYRPPDGADLDGAVGLADFAALAANFNRPSRWTGGDFNYDAVTSIADFALLAGNFNQSIPAARATVPEPGWGVAAAVLVALPIRRRARRG